MRAVRQQRVGSRLVDGLPCRRPARAGHLGGHLARHVRHIGVQSRRRGRRCPATALWAAPACAPARAARRRWWNRAAQTGGTPRPAPPASPAHVWPGVGWGAAGVRRGVLLASCRRGSSAHRPARHALPAAAPPRAPPTPTSYTSLAATAWSQVRAGKLRSVSTRRWYAPMYFSTASPREQRSRPTASRPCGQGKGACRKEMCAWGREQLQRDASGWAGPAGPRRPAPMPSQRRGAPGAASAPSAGH